MKKIPVKLSLDPWIDRLAFYHEHLLTMLRAGDERLIEAASLMHLHAAEDLLYFTRELRGSPATKNPGGRRIPLEILERDFLTMAARTSQEVRLAKKMDVRGGRQTKRALRAARMSENATRISANALKAEMERRGVWTDKFGRELGIEEWL